MGQHDFLERAFLEILDKASRALVAKPIYNATNKEQEQLILANRHKSDICNYMYTLNGERIFSIAQLT